MTVGALPIMSEILNPVKGALPVAPLNIKPYLDMIAPKPEYNIRNNEYTGTMSRYKLSRRRASKIAMTEFGKMFSLVSGAIPIYKLEEKKADDINFPTLGTS